MSVNLKEGTEVQEALCPAHMEKTLQTMKALRAIKCITFDCTEAIPGDTLYVSVPKLHENEVQVPGSLALHFDLDMDNRHANNFLIQSVMRALLEKLVVKFVGVILQDTVGYDIYKMFEDLFLPDEKRNNMVSEGIQSEDLCKIRSKAGDKKTSGVATENKVNEIHGNKYRIRLDHQLLTDNGIFYPQALYNDLVFNVTLAPALQVVKGSDPTKLKYKLINIQLKYEMIRSEMLADEAHSTYTGGKEFTYDHVMYHKVVPFRKDTDSRLNIKVNSQRRTMKAILLLFVEPYTAGTRDSQKYIFPDIKKVSITINGSPSMLYNNGIKSRDMWAEASHFFVKEKCKTKHLTLQKFYTDNKFGLLIDLHSMADQTLHSSGTWFVNTTNGVQLEIEWKASDLSNVNCHVFVISDSQFNIMDRDLECVQF